MLFKVKKIENNDKIFFYLGNLFYSILFIAYKRFK